MELDPKGGPTTGNNEKKRRVKRALLVLNTVLLGIGNCGGPLLLRLYFLHGGNRVWLSAGLETAGWPLNVIPLIFTYIHRRRNPGPTGPPKPVLMDLPVFLAAAVIGVLTGLDDYLYAYGVARLPVSTSALIIASQLGFTALFAFLLVKQRFTAFSMNAVFLLTMGAVVLGISSSNDRPAGESNRQYYLGFATVVMASVLYGFVLPLVELMYKKAKQAITYTLVLEIQLVMCFFATAFCVVGMIINNDFKVIPREAREYKIGEAHYYVVLVSCSILWQCFFLGAIGVVFCASSLYSAIIIAVLLPATEVLAVIFYKEKFRAEKGVSLALSLWGFISYFYGEIKHNKVKDEEAQGSERELS